VVIVNTGTCPFCKKPGKLEVPPEVLDRYDGGRGMFIQNAWPEGSADEREQLLSGIHGKCFDDAFPDDE
jgi:hypothetical protein